MVGGELTSPACRNRHPTDSLRLVKDVVGRLAPSPTGALHLGNARSFLLAWLSVRAQGGMLLCRIDDIDGPRVKEGATEEALGDLDWIGLDFDVGPFFQSTRSSSYALAMDHLKTHGLVYPCVCTRSEIERAQSAPQEALDHGTRYPGTCRELYEDAQHAFEATGREPAWRFRVPDDCVVEFTDEIHGAVSIDVAADSGDFVVAKKDGQTAYQLATVVDDGECEVTEILRGDDLLGSTPRQILLYRALGFVEPSWIHVPLVVGPDGRRLAKRHGDTRISWYRRRGIAGEELLGWLAWSCGLVESRDPVSAAELVEEFDLSKISREETVLERDPWAS